MSPKPLPVFGIIPAIFFILGTVNLSSPVSGADTTCLCPDDKDVTNTTSYCGHQISEEACKPNAMYCCKDKKPGDPATFIKECQPCAVGFVASRTNAVSFFGTCHPLGNNGTDPIVAKAESVGMTTPSSTSAMNTTGSSGGLDPDDNLDNPGEGFITTKFGVKSNQTVAAENATESD